MDSLDIIEILICIFNNLSEYEYLNIRLVNRKWNLAVEYHLRTGGIINLFDKQYNLSAIRMLTRYPKSISNRDLYDILLFACKTKKCSAIKCIYESYKIKLTPQQAGVLSNLLLGHMRVISNLPKQIIPIIILFAKNGYIDYRITFDLVIHVNSLELLQYIQLPNNHKKIHDAILAAGVNQNIEMIEFLINNSCAPITENILNRMAYISKSATLVLISYLSPQIANDIDQNMTRYFNICGTDITSYLKAAIQPLVDQYRLNNHKK